MKKLLVIVTKPPYSREEPFGAISFAGTGPAADVSTGVVFSGEGVYNAVKNQITLDYFKVGENSYSTPNIEKLIKDMNDVGVSFFALDKDIKERCIESDELIEAVKIINEENFAEFILEYDVSVVF